MTLSISSMKSTNLSMHLELPKILDFGTPEIHLVFLCQKPCSKPTLLLKVFDYRTLALGPSKIP